MLFQFELQHFPNHIAQEYLTKFLHDHTDKKEINITKSCFISEVRALVDCIHQGKIGVYKFENEQSKGERSNV
jgi:hypothetical protein